jgi:hypothetical protein
MDDVLNKIALSEMPISYFKDWYRRVKESSYRNGSDDAKEEIRRSLGV